MNPDFARIRLAPGYSISRVIKGGWQLAGGHGPIDEKQAIEDMRSFVEAGITTFDCADIYTGVEELIGKFIKKYHGAFISGEVSPVQIHTKYVPDLDQLPTLTKSDTEAVIDRSLKRLNVPRLDLVQFHWWDYSIKRYVDAAWHLQELKNAGKIAHIGVTNFDARHLKEILEAGVDIISNQVQYSIIDDRPGKNLVPLCREYNVSLLCYGTLAGGFFSEGYLHGAETADALENRSLTKYKLIIDDFGGFQLFQELLRILNGIAAKHQVGIGEAAIKFILQKPRVAGVIVGARSAAHLEKLKKLESFYLDDDDLNMISPVLARGRRLNGPVYALERIRNGKHGKIMKYNLNQLSND